MSETGSSMTLEEKQKLSEQINSMNMVALGGVAEILMRRVPELKQYAGLEIKLDLETVDDATLRELDAYCAQETALVKRTAAAAAAHEVLSGASRPAAAIEVDDAPPSKKARLSAAYDEGSAASKMSKAEKDSLTKTQKADVLIGCERLLREAHRPLTQLELLYDGTDKGFFHITVQMDAAQFVSSTLKADIKSNKSSVFQNLGKNGFALREFAMPEDEEKRFARERNMVIAAHPAPEPATAPQRDLMRAYYVHKELYEKHEQWIFCEPVDPIKLGLPDYHQIIKHPMDLGTVKKKLSAGKYDSLDDWKADVDLIWSNAMTYNPVGTDVHRFAKEYSDFVEEKMKKHGLLSTLPEPEKADHKEVLQGAGGAASAASATPAAAGAQAQPQQPQQPQQQPAAAASAAEASTTPAAAGAQATPAASAAQPTPAAAQPTTQQPAAAAVPSPQKPAETPAAANPQPTQPANPTPAQPTATPTESAAAQQQPSAATAQAGGQPAAGGNTSAAQQQQQQQQPAQPTQPTSQPTPSQSTPAAQSGATPASTSAPPPPPPVTSAEASPPPPPPPTTSADAGNDSTPMPVDQ